MSNKVCIVTGASSGIGKATAKELARRGMTVILACRAGLKSDSALAEIQESTNSQAVHLVRLDLASLSSIRDFTEEIEARFDRLDVLINNAAVVSRERQRTENGFELQFGVNHLGHFALTNRLRPLLERSASSRIIVVSSEVYRAGRISWEDLHSDQHYGMMPAYAQSKLANILFTRELAKRVRGVTVNALHPGSASTDILREASFAMRVFLKLFSSTPDKAAQTLVFLALSPDVAAETGKYFLRGKEARLSQRAMNDDDAVKLWEISENLTEFLDSAFQDKNMSIA